MVGKRKNDTRGGRGLVSLAALLFVGCVSAQQPPAPTSGPAAVFDGARAFEHLKQVVAIGPRPAGSEGARKTRDYIKQQMSALGLTATEQAFDAATPVGTVKMVNVSVRLPGGPGNPSTGSGQGRRLIFAGHYDTKLFKEFTFVGANDAGSSTAFLIELARVLKDRKNEVPIELLFLDGEEAFGEWESGNTFGSRHYVDAARKAGTLKEIGALVLVDMIGEKNPVFKREEASTPWLVDAIWSAARRLNRPEFVAESTPVSDDHLPFLEAGIPAADIIDLDYPDEMTRRFWHTAEDTIDKCSPDSLKAVGDVLLAALPAIELRLK
jgi:glutaminyl-peptide cyclotransferase